MLIVVLGGGIDLQGNIPSHVVERLDKALKLHSEHPDFPIVLSGKYSFLAETPPPMTEAAAMKQYLITKGVPDNMIILEDNAMDTISNAYYLKTNIFMPRSEKTAIIITSKFHLERTEYIFHKVFGDSYTLRFESVDEDFPPEKETQILDHQKEVLMKTQQFLQPMTTGDHTFLQDKFFNADFYIAKRPDWVANFVAKGL